MSDKWEHKGRGPGDEGGRERGKASSEGAGKRTEERGRAASAVHPATSEPAGGGEEPMGYVTASLVHALNTTLQAVIGYSDILVEGAPLPPNVQPAAEKIRQYSQTCAMLVRSLLALVRVEPVHPQAVDVGRLIVEVGRYREAELREQRVRLVMPRPSSALVAWADPGRLRHALMDLMDAALRMLDLHGGGELTVEAARHDDEVVIRLRDTGPGYPESDQAFEPSRVRPGLDWMSLRLAVAAAIIGDAGGELRVTNTPMGGCLTISLRSAPAPEAAEAPIAPRGRPEEAPRAIPGHARILVVDDAPLFLMLSRRVLGSFGQILTATSAEQAIELLGEGEVDLIITDVWMPGALDGMGLYRWLLQERPQMAERVVFSTADVVSPELEEFLAWAQRPCIRKPFNIRQYRATVWSCLKR